MVKKEEIFVGLDIGSFKITTVVGRADEEGELNIIGVGTSFSTGVRKGIVTEIEAEQDVGVEEYFHKSE